MMKILLVLADNLILVINIIYLCSVEIVIPLYPFGLVWLVRSGTQFVLQH